MTGHFEYVYVKQSMDSLDIDDIGNCYLETCNDTGECFYLAIRTSLGFSRVVEYGPYADGIRLPSVSAVFNQFEYNEKKLNKIIYLFLNNPGRQITQARELTEEEYRDIITHLLNPVLLLWDNKND